MLLASLSPVVSTPRVKSLNETFSMPSILRRQGVNGRIARAVNESLGREAGAHTSLRLAHIVGIAEVAQVKFVDHVSALRTVVRPRLANCARPSGDGIEARNTGSALRRRVGIVERVVVKEIVARQADSRPLCVSIRAAPLSSRRVSSNADVEKVFAP